MATIEKRNAIGSNANYSHIQSKWMSSILVHCPNLPRKKINKNVEQNKPSLMHISSGISTFKRTFWRVAPYREHVFFLLKEQLQRTKWPSVITKAESTCRNRVAFCQFAWGVLWTASGTLIFVLLNCSAPPCIKWRQKVDCALRLSISRAPERAWPCWGLILHSCWAPSHTGSCTRSLVRPSALADTQESWQLQ
jgi:hypothetical protein